jgi:hypothetical protein
MKNGRWKMKGEKWKSHPSQHSANKKPSVGVTAPEGFAKGVRKTV